MNVSFVQLACIWEASARKAGNVHRYANFADLTYLDFILSAMAIAPVFDLAEQQTVGSTVLQSMQATREVVSGNTNLGIILILAPLAKVPQGQDLRSGVQDALEGLTVADSRKVYQAIRLASPGGMGKVENQDIQDEPTETLREVMAMAAERDTLALQYTNNYREIFEIGVPALTEGWQQFQSVEAAILHTQLVLLSQIPDSLIVRKCGLAEAQEATHLAKKILELGGLSQPAGQTAYAQLDRWLRGKGHQRNPGTTADMVTACLFIALRECRMNKSYPFPWAVEFSCDAD